MYQKKPKKNVLLLSTLHTDAAIADSQKKTPETVKCYNAAKHGVDVVDQMARKYTVRTMTRRWPVHSFQNTLNLAAINAWVLYKKINSVKIPRRQFLQNLAEELGMPFVKSFTMPHTTEEADAGADQHFQQPTTRNCQVKYNCKKNRSFCRCYKCKKSLYGKCTANTQLVCTSCNKILAYCHTKLMVGGLFVQQQIVHLHFVHVFLSYFVFVKRFNFKEIDFGPIFKKRSLVAETLTLNPIGQKDVDEMLLD